MNNQSLDRVREMIRTILFNWHKWRDYYYSDLKEQVITDDEWKTTRDKIDNEAISEIQNLINSELQNLRQELAGDVEGREKDGCRLFHQKTKPATTCSNGECLYNGAYNEALTDVLAIIRSKDVQE